MQLQLNPTQQPGYPIPDQGKQQVAQEHGAEGFGLAHGEWFAGWAALVGHWVLCYWGVKISTRYQATSAGSM